MLLDVLFCLFFFFFKQKTAYEIYQCDWSSDVCSSDLADLDAAAVLNVPIKGISVSLGHVTGTDESVITYIRGAARYKYALLTPQDVIS